MSSGPLLGTWPLGRAPSLRALVDKLVLQPTESTLLQFARYAVVGGIAFVCDFTTLWALTEWVGVHYLWSALAGFLVGLVTNYLLSVRFVFAERRITNRWGEFGLFATIGIVGVGINELVMWALTDGLHAHYLWSKLGATVIVYVWNFTARKKLMF